MLIFLFVKMLRICFKWCIIVYILGYFFFFNDGWCNDEKWYFILFLFLFKMMIGVKVIILDCYRLFLFVFVFK